MIILDRRRQNIPLQPTVSKALKIKFLTILCKSAHIERPYANSFGLETRERKPSLKGKLSVYSGQRNFVAAKDTLKAAEKVVFSSDHWFSLNPFLTMQM